LVGDMWINSPSFKGSSIGWYYVDGTY